MPHRNLIGLLSAWLLVSTAQADNWPTWRGPRGDGHCSEKDLPLTWSDKENVRWKVALPGPGNSTPTVWGNRIFVTQSFDKKGHRRGIICFDRAKGDKLWEKIVDYKEVEKTHGTNPFCAGSPVTDGKRVVACYGSPGVFCYDMDGNERWRYDTGELRHIWGHAITPVLYKDLVILWCSPGPRQFLLALDLEKGTKVYQVDVPGGNLGENNKEWLGTWCTPTIARIGDRDELILGVPQELRGYDPKTGELFWSCDVGSPLMYTSAFVNADGVAVAFYGYGGAGIAVRAGGKGDVTKTHRLWLQKGNPQRICSPVVVGKHAYMVSEPGTAHCFDIETGKDNWSKARLECGKVWSSLVLSGDRLYVGSDNGEVVVLRADPARFEILARNELGKDETIRGSLAVSDGEVFIRTYRHLWCISEKKAK